MKDTFSGGKKKKQPPPEKFPQTHVHIFFFNPWKFKFTE